MPGNIFGTMDEFEWEVFKLSQNQEFMSYLDQARARARREGTLSIAEVRHRLKIPTSSDTNANAITESNGGD